MKPILLILIMSLSMTQAQIAKGATKFLGNITTHGTVRDDFASLWNQITAENECKWESVEGRAQNERNWTGCDRVYNYARANNMPTKFHTLVWGSQYPKWMDNLNQEQQLAAVTAWMDAAQERYTDLDLIDVVNEAVPGHAVPTFKNALGGDGATGYDWIINCFKMARERWPNAILIYNDYNELTWQKEEFKDLMNRIKGSGYVDAMGFQAHGWQDLSGPELKRRIDEMYNSVKLPIYISEYDIDKESDQEQLNIYKAQFPVMWEHPQVAGVTIWGYIHGSTWIPHSGLIKNGQDRPAMTWLKDYVSKNLNVPAPQVGSGEPPPPPPPPEPKGPWNDKVHSIPGVIQAQHYDLGGESVSYHDTDNINEGGAFREDGVDIEVTGDVSGDYNIGYIRDGEWLEYTVNVEKSGVYELDLRVASQGDGKSLDVLMDGKKIAENVEIPDTDGWQDWTTITVNNLNLKSGEQLMRLVFNGDYFNLNWVEFKPQTSVKTLFSKILQENRVPSKLYDLSGRRKF